MKNKKSNPEGGLQKLWTKFLDGKYFENKAFEIGKVK
jgi:hypothetical protein